MRRVVGSEGLRLTGILMVIIDVQERFRGHIHAWDEVVNAIRFLGESLNEIGVEVVATEQTPDKLGPTVEELNVIARKRFVKNEFDAFDNKDFRSYVLRKGIRELIITGIETHICVTQTAISALNHDIVPIVVYDATSSFSEEDKWVALDRLSAEGAVIVPAESVVYELMGSSKHPSFRKVTEMVKFYRKQRKGNK